MVGFIEEVVLFVWVFVVALEGGIVDIVCLDEVVGCGFGL